MYSRKGSGYGNDFGPYVSSTQTLKCEEHGYCPAISQGRIIGIDPHSAEHVVHIRPTRYLEGEGEEYYDEPWELQFTCFATIRLPYEAARGALLYELSRGILLITADRAVASDEAGPAESFFSIISRLQSHWEGGVGLVLSFIPSGFGVGDGKMAWPRGEPTWTAGHMTRG